MKVAILSGKGGTGKTFVAVNLAAAVENCSYIDADVEAPNGDLFFKSAYDEKNEVTVAVPHVDNLKCNGCKSCVEFCRFNALAYVQNQVMVFDDICHSCGGCSIVCPQNAISERSKSIGEVTIGSYGPTKIVTGKMHVGEATGVPIIKKLLEKIENVVIVDGPPGSGCAVMEVIKSVDYCVLVAEPSEFGKHNLKMVHELVEIFNKPYGVVLNKTTVDSNPSKQYCLENNLKVLMEISYDRELGYLNSSGKIAASVSDAYKKKFLDLFRRIKLEGSCETVAGFKR